MSDPNSGLGAGSSKNLTDFINFPRGAIGKRGLPATRNARLPSIRNPRDLTLGGLSLGVAPKRTFVPNIPVRRDKSVQDATASANKGATKNAGGTHERKRDSKFERGRGRGGKNKFELIQTAGIFSEGIGDGSRKASSSSRSRNDSNDAPGIPRPTKTLAKREAKDEKGASYDPDMLKNLLRDDFIDDGSDDENNSLQPVLLPFTQDINGSIKSEKDSKLSISIKKEPVNIKMEEDEVKPDVKPKAPIIKEPEDPYEIFSSKNIEDDQQLLFVQFPDVLGVPAQPEDSKPLAKSSLDAPDTSATSDGVTLADFPEGYIGKVQLLKSGKTRLVLGSMVLDVKMGAPFNTLQDLVSVRTNTNGGDMTVLGHVHHKLICMPDVENLMSQCTV